MSDLKIKAIRITHPNEVLPNGDIFPFQGRNEERQYWKDMLRGYTFLEKKLGGRALFFYLRHQNEFGKLPDWIDIDQYDHDTLITEFLVPSDSLLYYAEKWETGPMLEGPVTFDIDDSRLDDPAYQKLIEDDWENIFISKIQIHYNMDDIEGICKRIPKNNIIRQYKMKTGWKEPL